MSIKRSLRYFDWFSFTITILMLMFGLLFVFSSTYRPDRPFSLFFKKQAFGMISGMVLYAFFCFKDLRSFSKVGYQAYYVVLAMLVYTILGGWIGMGAKRWISLYFFRFQPSEVVKLFLPVFIASFFSSNVLKKYGGSKTIPIKNFLYPLGILFASFILIRKQPDLGTALIVLFSGLLMLWFIGLNRKFFIISGCLIVLGAPILWTFLKPYQQKRIKVLFGYGDVKKERYQVEQSKIAIGSGGLTGKGFLQGTQSKLNFLPEDHTDFIFSVICEEWGFLGALLVLLLFLLLFIRLFLVVMDVTSFFDQIIALGLIAHILLSVCINIGMVIGILPVVGIPLPLFSYGLTNLWINLASLGWLNNIAIRRFYY